MDNLCVVCGSVIPEGRQVCPNCEKEYGTYDSMVVVDNSISNRCICWDRTDGVVLHKRRLKGK